MKKTLLTLLLFVLGTWSVWSQPIKFPAVYGDGMVVQRGVPLRFWANTTPGTQVQVALGDVKGTATANAQGHFEVTLPAQKAGGPYNLTFTSGNSHHTFTSVYVGEVWLCSGQSNMELRTSEISTAREDLKTADTLTRVHLYNMESAWPLIATKWNEARADSVDSGRFIKHGKWESCSAKTAGRFSAIGLHFARLLADSLNCHIGILSNAVGGATTEGWIDSTALAATIPEILQGNWRTNPNIMAWARKRADYNLQNLKHRNHSHPYAPGYLYYAAIRPIAGYPMRGVLWYQGESNAELIDMHKRLFPLLQSSWRQAWQNPDMPFYFVQLSGISTRPTWPAFRNSQRLLADSLPHTYMTVSSDVGDSLDVHPRQKRIVAERMAASALHHTYGYTHITPSGPQPLSAHTEAQNHVRIQFTEADGLHFAGPPQPATFEVAGSDNTFYPATQADIEGNTVVISTPQVDLPTKVRYAWQPFTHANLANGASMPCSTFEIQISER